MIRELQMAAGVPIEEDGSPDSAQGEVREAEPEAGTESESEYEWGPLLGYGPTESSSWVEWHAARESQISEWNAIKNALMKRSRSMRMLPEINGVCYDHRFQRYCERASGSFPDMHDNAHRFFTAWTIAKITRLEEAHVTSQEDGDSSSDSDW